MLTTPTTAIASPTAETFHRRADTSSAASRCSIVGARVIVETGQSREGGV